MSLVHRLSGLGLLKLRLLMLFGRGSALFRVACADVFLYRYSSVAPLLNMRRRLKAVMDVFDDMVRYGIGRTYCSVGQDLGFWSLYPVTHDDLDVVRGLGIGGFYQVASGVHYRLSNFIHSVVVHRRDEAVRGWRNWIREDPMVHPYRWLQPDLVPPAPFLQCEPHLTPGGSGVFADPAKTDEEFRKAWLPYKGIPALRNSVVKLMGGYHFSLRFLCPG